MITSRDKAHEARHAAGICRMVAVSTKDEAVYRDACRRRAIFDAIADDYEALDDKEKPPRGQRGGS